MTVRRPLVLLPGLLEDEAVWQPQIAAIGDIAAPSVADLTRQDSVGALAEAVLAEAADRFALAGHSMGGYVALEIVRRAPRRVLALALLNTSARADTPEQTRRRKALLALAKRGRFKGVTPRLLPQLIHPDRLQDETVTAPIMTMAERVGQEAFERQQRAIMGRDDQREFLARIACPTLVLCGREDQITPLDRSEELAEGIPGARLVTVERCGHVPTLERPDAVNGALRAWLEG